MKHVVLTSHVAAEQFRVFFCKYTHSTVGEMRTVRFFFEDPQARFGPPAIDVPVSLSSAKLTDLRPRSLQDAYLNYG